MKFSTLLTLTLFFAILLMGLTQISDYDIWYHLKTGEWVLQHMQVPHHDPFSFTVNHDRWFAHEWLSQLLFYLSYLGGCLPGVIFLKGTLILATFFFVFLRCQQLRAHPFYTASFVFLAALLSAGSFTARPHLFSFLFFALTLFLLPRARSPFVYFLLGFFWVNLHSSFILLFILLLAYGFFEKKQFLWKPLLAAVLGAMFNPNGWQMFLYPFTVALNPAHTENIQEWLSPNFHLPQMWLLEGVFILPVLLFSKNKLAPHRFFLFLYIFFVHLALQSVRHIPLLAIALAPYFAAYLTQLLPRPSLEARAALHWIFPLLYIPILLFTLPTGKQESDYIQKKDFPIQAVQFLAKQSLPSHLLTTYEWGGYAIFSLYPHYRIFIDGRMDLYGKKIMPDYLKLLHAEEGFALLLLKYQVDVVLFPRKSSLVRELKELGWEVLFENKKSTILVPPTKESHSTYFS